MIIDCPPTFNPRSNLAIKNADFVLIPVRPDYYATLHFSRIHKIAGDSKRLFQLPLVKIGFTDNVASKEADSIIRQHDYKVLGELPVYAKIAANISSNKNKWWSVGLKDFERQHFEFIYKQLEAFHKKFEMLKMQTKIVWGETDYYEDPENPDIAIWGRN